MNMNKLIISFLLIIAFLAAGCSDDQPKDAVKEIKMTVSSETGSRYVLGSEQPVECMLVMSEDDPGVWVPLDFNSIKGFTYEKGHEYYLSVERTILANPPMDASDRTYSLLSILYDRLITEPEIPVDKEINSEEDIAYYDLCPFGKYDVEKEYIVDENGKIYYSDGRSLPSYDAARIYLKNVMSKEDPDWLEFNSIPYQAYYSYVLSPLNDEIRLIHNDSSEPLFKSVIPLDEFNHIKSMKPGDELHYTLILANIYKRGLQKLGFTVKKQ